MILCVCRTGKLVSHISRISPNGWQSIPEHPLAVSESVPVEEWLVKPCQVIIILKDAPRKCLTGPKIMGWADHWLSLISRLGFAVSWWLNMLVALAAWTSLTVAQSQAAPGDSGPEPWLTSDVSCEWGSEGDSVKGLQMQWEKRDSVTPNQGEVALKIITKQRWPSTLRHHCGLMADLIVN